MMQRLGELYPATPVPLDHRSLYELLFDWSMAFRTSGRRNTIFQTSSFFSISTAVISSLRNFSS